MTTILVVDDQLDVRNLVSLHVRNAGYDCLHAKNGSEALQVIEENEPDVIVLDVMMPVMDGIETCRRIRNSGRHSAIYIIMLSAKSETVDKVDSLDIGADSYLTKPFVPDELLAQIRAGLRIVKDRHSAMIDPLTGLFNRRSFDSFLGLEKAENDRYHKAFSLAFLDIDHFKLINDEHGHDVGDLVLQDLAELIRANARPSDLPCRWGGEEFAWLMPNTDLQEATIAANRLRAAIARYRFRGVGSMTASMGVAVARRDEEISELVKRADEALYLAKNAGRNRVCIEGGSKRSVQTSPVVSAQKPTPGQQLRVLIVTADTSATEMIRSHILTRPVNVVVSTCPEKTADSYRPDFDLIILKPEFPSIDGQGLLHFLAENDCRAAIVLLGNGDSEIQSETERHALSLGLQVIAQLSETASLDAIDAVLQQASVLAYAKHAAPPAAAMTLVAGGTKDLPSVDELRSAISNDEIDIYFQPQIRIKGRILSGMEALARWHHPTIGFISPDYFVALAEKFNLIDPLTQMVIRKVCNSCKDWQGKWDAVPISINISVASLGNLNFPEEMYQIVEAHGVAPSTIMVEVTETSLATDPSHVLNVLKRLKLKGFQLSIDDFGTGHSSLSRLRKVPFRELKIDRTFIETCDTDNKSRIIVSKTIDLAHSLGLSVVAEGVETETQFDILEELNCDHVQGAFFCSALPAVDFEKWFDNRAVKQE